MVEGETARRLEELARERWQRATGEAWSIRRPRSAAAPWPAGIAPWWQHARIAIARTRPRFGRADRGARDRGRCSSRRSRWRAHVIYIENQYLTVPAVAAALAARLAEDDGPEVVIVSPDLCEGILETRVMDRGRDEFCKRLRGVGRDDRLRIMYPVHEAAGQPPVSINVHAKLMVVDDRLLIVGSANLARRSMGLDTETDLALEAADEADRQAIVARARHAARRASRLPARAAGRGDRRARLAGRGARCAERRPAAARDAGRRPAAAAAGARGRRRADRRRRAADRGQPRAHLRAGDPAPAAAAPGAARARSRWCCCWRWPSWCAIRRSARRRWCARR